MRPPAALLGARLRVWFKFLLTLRFRVRSGSGSACAALCVPSMGENQTGFKSPVYRMKTGKTTRGQLRKGDQPWEGRLWESRRPTNRNLIRGRQDRVSWHNTAKPCHSVPEVNEAVGWRRFSSLPGEISTARDRGSGSAVRSNALGFSLEVSRGHSTAIGNRGAGIRPFKLRSRSKITWTNLLVLPPRTGVGLCSKSPL